MLKELIRLHIKYIIIIFANDKQVKEKRLWQTKRESI